MKTAEPFSWKLSCFFDDEVLNFGLAEMPFGRSGFFNTVRSANVVMPHWLTVVFM